MTEAEESALVAATVSALEPMTARVAEESARICEALIDGTAGDAKLATAAAAIRAHAWDN